MLFRVSIHRHALRVRSDFNTKVLLRIQSHGIKDKSHIQLDARKFHDGDVENAILADVFFLQITVGIFQRDGDILVFDSFKIDQPASSGLAN